MRFLKYIILLLITILLSSCKVTEFDTPEQFYSYLNNPKSGYIRTKEYDKLSFKIKYLPPDYFVSNAIIKDANIGQNKIDSIYNMYKDSRTFLLTISTTDKSNTDIMYVGINTEEEYRQRFEMMNFNMGEYIYLKTGKNKYFPVLTNLENVYGLSKSRNINIVFAPMEINDDLYESATCEIYFEDVFFETGITHFTYNTKDLDKEIKLKYTKQ